RSRVVGFHLRGPTGRTETCAGRHLCAAVLAVFRCRGGTIPIHSIVSCNRRRSVSLRCAAFPWLNGWLIPQALQRCIDLCSDLGQQVVAPLQTEQQVTDLRG